VTRLHRSPTALVTLLVTVIWVLGYAIGADWWPLAIAVGYAVGIPIASVYLEGDQSSSEESEPASDESASQTTTAGADATPTEAASTASALETLRERYAAGDLSETQFEAKLEQLLETETVEDASAYVETDGSGGSSEATGERPTRETERE